MANVRFNTPVMLDMPSGAFRGDAKASVEYNLNEHDQIEVPTQSVAINLEHLEPVGEVGELPVLGGRFRVVIEEWGIDDHFRITLSRRPTMADYEGSFDLDDVPSNLRERIESGSNPAFWRSGSPERPPAQETDQAVLGRPLAAEISLLEAKQHIDAAKALIWKYINQEPEPEEFGLAVLEALLREVDSLGDQLEVIVSSRVVPPTARRSVSVIEWIKAALVIKAGLRELAQVLEEVIRIFR